MYKIRASNFKREEFVRTTHVVEVEENVSFDDLLKPAAWAHVARELKPGDKIVLMPVEGHYNAELFVRDCGRTWAKVAKLAKVDFETLALTDDATGEFKIERKGLAGYCVIRKGDNAIIVQGLKTQPDAQIALAEHIKATT
jgi:hypothetical protein